MSATTIDGVPWLDCPDCGEPLIPATGRGRHDDDGNYIEHRSACRCPHCEWMWFEDDGPPTTCKCGTVACVKVDDDHAYATEVAAEPSRVTKDGEG